MTTDAMPLTGMPTHEGDLSIEAHGMDPIPEGARYGSVRRLFTVWFTPNLVPAAFFIGTLVTLDFLKLGFVTSILAIVVGNVVGSFFVALLSTMGPKLGLAQMPAERQPGGGHLGQAELRAHRAQERDEERADHVADDDRQDRRDEAELQEVECHQRPEEERRRDEVRGEPDREEPADRAVPSAFGDRFHPVGLDRKVTLVGGHSREGHRIRGHLEAIPPLPRAKAVPGRGAPWHRILRLPERPKSRFHSI